MASGEPLAGLHPTREPVIAYVGLGANLGDAAAALRQAVLALRQLPGTQVRLCSSLYKSAALETSAKAQADYLNAVVEISTRLNAALLLDHLLRIEQSAGRERPYHHAPRTLDLDLLLYGSASIESPRLTVPHPRMMQRAFVLVPLAEIAPQRMHRGQLEALAAQTIERLGGLLM